MSGLTVASANSDTSQVQTVNPIAQTALENRITALIQKIKLAVVTSDKNIPLDKILCPITKEVLQDPVVTNCGHVYERSVTKYWKPRIGYPRNHCPKCEEKLTSLASPDLLQKLIQKLQKENPIPTCTPDKVLNATRAAIHLQTAKSFIDCKDYQGALDAYGSALQYTNSLETYAHLPNLYTQLGDLQKAGLARLHLSLYQYQESNIQGAIDTLNSCKSDTFNTDHLTMGLKLLLDPSSETIEEAYTCAENLQNPKDRIFIYQQILLHNPSDLDAYKYLIPLIKDPKEKKEMILNAIKLTHGSLINLAKSFRAQLNATILTSENWKIASTLELPPYPPELEAFLREDCTFWPGKPKSETHIIIPLFPYAEVNNQIVPLNSDILNDIDRSVGGVGLSNSNNFSDYECPADTEFRWAVMTNNIIPRSLGKSYDELIKLLPPGYKAADDVRSVAIGLLWDNQRSGKVLFFSDKAYYTYCEKRTPGSKAPIIGHNLIDDLFRIRSCGLLASSQERDENTGIAAFRKF